MASTKNRALTFDEAFDQFERDLGLSEPELATVLGVSPELLARWRAGQSVSDGEAKRRLTQLRDLHRHLRDTFTTPAVIPEYLRTPLPYLGRQTPIDALLAGRIDRVEAALEALDSGAFV
jgi:hypothetical protein